MAVIRRKLGFDNILVPLDFVNLILRLRNRENRNTFQVGCFKNVMFIKSEDLVLFARLIDGEFPDYSQVIPNDCLRYASADKAKLFHAIKRIMLMSGKNYEMRFEFQPCSLVLSSFTPDLGNAAEEIEIEYRSDMDENKSFVIALNGRYLLDMLEVLEGKRVNIGMGNEFLPIKVEEDDSTHILMPIRLAEAEPQPEPLSTPENELEPAPEILEEEGID